MDSPKLRHEYNKSFGIRIKFIHPTAYRVSQKRHFKDMIFNPKNVIPGQSIDQNTKQDKKSL